MVGIGCGIATIMMSSTPFWLANTGGSLRVWAPAVPDHMTAIAAAPIQRHADIHPVCVIFTRTSFNCIFVCVHAAARPRAVTEALDFQMDLRLDRTDMLSHFRSASRYRSTLKFYSRKT